MKTNGECQKDAFALNLVQMEIVGTHFLIIRQQSDSLPAKVKRQFLGSGSECAISTRVWICSGA